MPQNREFLSAAAALTSGDPGEKARYELARKLAHQAQIIRVVYSAMNEGIFDDGISLAIADPSQPHAKPSIINSADALQGFLYTHNSTQLLSLALCEGGSKTPLEDVSALWQGALRTHTKRHMGDEFDRDKWNHLQYELLNSLNNEALSFYAQLQMNGQLRESAKAHTNLWEWLTHESITESFPHHDLDSLLLQLGSFSGHRTHPSSKMRLMVEPGQNQSSRVPLSDSQQSRFAPEYAPDVPLQVLAVRAGKVTVKMSEHEREGYHRFFAKGFPDAYAQWRRAVEHAVGAAHAAEYVPIPIHPLHLPEVGQRFKGNIENQDILLTDVTITQRPTLSFRTLTPVHDPSQPQIKTTVNMQLTSVVRTLAPPRAYNAPVFSDILHQVVKNDAKLAQCLRPVEEVAAIYWGTDSDPDSKQFKDGYQLSSVFKSNPAQLVKKDEIRMPVNVLLSPSALSGKPVLVDIMRASGVNDARSALDYFTRYAKLAVASDVGILSRYGIGLEGHQQNTDMVFGKDGTPHALVYRDINGGIEICEPMLQANGIALEGKIHPVQKGVYPDIDTPLKQTMHTTFMMHLFPVLHIIGEHYGIPKQEMFDILRDQVQRTIADAREEHLPALLEKQPAATRDSIRKTFSGQLDEIEAGLTSKAINTKCLLMMRIRQSQDVVFAEAPNPMRAR